VCEAECSLGRSVTNRVVAYQETSFHDDGQCHDICSCCFIGPVIECTSLSYHMNKYNMYASLLLLSIFLSFLFFLDAFRCFFLDGRLVFIYNHIRHQRKWASSLK